MFGEDSVRQGLQKLLNQVSDRLGVGCQLVFAAFDIADYAVVNGVGLKFHLT